MHLNFGRCNSQGLFEIIEKENPKIIFEETDILRAEDEYYIKGIYKIHETTVEAVAVMYYLEKYNIKQVPVDTFEFVDVPKIMYKKISDANIEYNNHFKEIFIMVGEK